MHVITYVVFTANYVTAGVQTWVHVELRNTVDVGAYIYLTSLTLDLHLSRKIWSTLDPVINLSSVSQDSLLSTSAFTVYGPFNI